LGQGIDGLKLCLNAVAESLRVGYFFFEVSCDALLFMDGGQGMAMVLER